MKTDLKSIYNGMSRDVFDKLIGTNSYVEVPWFTDQYPCTIIKNTYVIGYAGYSGVDSRPITEESSYGILNYWSIQYSGITGWGTYYFWGNEYDKLESLDGPSSPIDKDDYKDLFKNCKPYSDKPKRKFKIITLCGSTKFKDAFLSEQKRLTLEGNIVISAGLFGHSGDDLEGKKEMLDEMHLRKIDLADEIFVINVDEYIGESTRKEIEYATKQNKQIHYLNEVN